MTKIIKPVCFEPFKRYAMGGGDVESGLSVCFARYQHFWLLLFNPIRFNLWFYSCVTYEPDNVSLLTLTCTAVTGGSQVLNWTRRSIKQV